MERSPYGKTQVKEARYPKAYICYIYPHDSSGNGAGHVSHPANSTQGNDHHGNDDQHPGQYRH